MQSQCTTNLNARQQRHQPLTKVKSRRLNHGASAFSISNPRDDQSCYPNRPTVGARARKILATSRTLAIPQYPHMLNHGLPVSSFKMANMMAATNAQTNQVMLIRPCSLSGSTMCIGLHLAKHSLTDLANKTYCWGRDGTPYRIRTCDPLIKSQLLYQLS